jgi:hypothetical protein
VCATRVSDQVEAAIRWQNSAFEKLSSYLTAATSGCPNNREFHGFLFCVKTYVCAPV